MLTTRNIFIANLALSDIFLCAFTMPLTLVDLITKFWTLGENQVIIKNVSSSTSHKKLLVFFRPYSHRVTFFKIKVFCLKSYLIKTFNVNIIFYKIKLDLEGHWRSHWITLIFKFYVFLGIGLRIITFKTLTYVLMDNFCPCFGMSKLRLWK